MKKNSFVMTAFTCAVLAVGALALGACANVVAPDRPVPEYDYKKYPPVMLDVSSVQVVDYIPTMQPAHVEHLMPQPLPVAVSDWARDRFKPVGTQGVAFITVREATMIETDLDRTKGIKGVFTVDQAERYDAQIIVEFRIEGRDPEPNGSGIVKVERSQTIGEDASLQYRDRIWTKMEERMLSDLDAATQRMLRQRLSFVLTK